MSRKPWFAGAGEPANWSLPDICTLFRRDDLVVLIGNIEINLSLGDFLQRDASRLGLTNVDIGPRICSTLKLLTSLGGEDDHAVFRIYDGRIIYLDGFVSGFFGCDFGLYGHIFAILPVTDAL